MSARQQRQASTSSKSNFILNQRPSQDKLLKRKEKEEASAFAALPSVPGVDNLDPKDLSFSSFFSLHRPLSLTNPFPPSVTEEAFAALFESKVEQDPWANGNSAERRPEDVIYALSQTIESIEKASAQNDVVHLDVLTESASNEEATTHLDSLPRARIPTLEEIVAQALPFQAPPPPQPFPSEPKQEKKRATRQSRQASPRTKSYTTTIVVTESRMPNGETTYAASASPIVRLPDPVAADVQSQRKSWMPYRRRRSEAIAPAHFARTQRYNIRNPRTQSRIGPWPGMQKSSMLLISVKRQRRLKMKKHKYKKLMKRTRNLRRRLENK
ncbi:hypothetical protein AMS68_001152 [Peltaster fructicola]|uniref:Small ribosomal subunit protein mS38 n=1 Tax=Peltaster fructicola TaxID=286661 RepID=A0A6H0XLX8_9PEZI|nr:hypothetical protein AMS68_001152 [Peltaster fructicola]